MATQDVLAPSVMKAPAHRVVQLDFVRGVAILLVLSYHYVSATGGDCSLIEEFCKRSGWIGVDLFFVLSGFLVGGLLVRELLTTGTIRVGRFLMRRMLKILPAYYFYLAFHIIVRKHPLSTFLWQNALNIQNYAGTSLLHTWSLAVEEHFYVLLPAALLLMHKSRYLRGRVVQVLAAICAVVFAGRYLTYICFGSGVWVHQTQVRLDALLFGVMLSYVLCTSETRFRRMTQRRVLCSMLSVLVLSIATLVDPNSGYMVTIGYSVNYICFAGLFLLVYGYRGRLTRTWIYLAVAWLGRYSYGIYLWHLSVREPVAALVSHIHNSVQRPCLYMAEFASAIGLGFIATKAIEFPVLRLRERILPREDVKAAAPAAKCERVSVELTALSDAMPPQAHESVAC